MIKRLVALFLVLLLSIESFGAVVSDNDGSAFITKAEFDSLKNNFQSQIDQYNTSIDAKIDGAIAAYLSGIRVSTKYELNLDPNCNYKFPLVMLSDEKWNDPESVYFDVSIPGVQVEEYWLKWKTIGANGAPAIASTGQDIGKWDISSIPNLYDTATSYKGLAIQKVNLNWKFDGQNGPINILNKTSKTRNINGTNRNVYNLNIEGFGKYGLVYFNGLTNFQESSAYDMVNNYTIYPAYHFIGFSKIQIQNKRSPYGYTWNNVTSRPVWTVESLPSMRTGFSAYSTHTPLTIPDCSNLNEVITTINTAYNGDSSLYNTWDEVGGQYEATTPTSTHIEWQRQSYRKYCYSGSAKMPAQLENHFSLNVVPSADASRIPLIYKSGPNYYGTDWLVIKWRNVDQIQDAPRPWYQFWPQFVATDLSSYEWESNDDFSMVRASCVSYSDKDGNDHYMDEGMYLGKMDRSGTVKFTLNFASDSDSNIKLAISKKPFSFDALSSNKIAYEYTNLSTAEKNNVTAGNDGILTSNIKYTISIANIEKGDALYLCWSPQTEGEYVELESFEDYYLEADN